MPAAALIASHNFASASSSDSDVPSSSARMDSNPRPIASVLVLRCMRCARSAETTTTDDASTAGMVRISHNLYYCERCAKLVGYKRPLFAIRIGGVATLLQTQRRPQWKASVINSIPTFCPSTQAAHGHP
ncbi:hypothetical protein V8C42DRAFT_347415 [Trichoderma barbatum]